jgi:hypothetical protein
MTLAFNPSSVSFGDVPIGNQGARAITITNPDQQAKTVTVSGDGAFRLDPPSVTVPAAGADGTKGSATAVVYFQPTTAASVTATLRGDSQLCNLSGHGVTGDMADETAFTNKALFLKVPDYTVDSFEQFRASPAVESLSSFLRLGAFDIATETDRSKQLLALIHQAGPSGDPARGDHQAGSSGDAWAWADTDPFSQVPPLQPRSTSAPAAKAGNHDVFFLEDVRKRDIDVVTTAIADADVSGNGLTMIQRQSESARLYSRGGWRDHSDGNRITTTYGDKVEIIRGNYKMIVMGRQDDPSHAMGWEASGDQIMDYAPGWTAGGAMWIEWIKDYAFTTTGGGKQTGVWLQMSQNEGIYQYDRTAGTTRSEDWGDLRESYVGSENPPSTGVAATDATTGTQGHAPPTKLAGINYDLPNTNDDRNTPAFTFENQDCIRSNPHIVEKTWARRIDSWTGSEALGVPHIEEHTYADEIYGYTGSATKRVTTAHDETWATDTFELVDVSDRIESNTRAGSIFEATTAGTIWESTTSMLHLSLEVGPSVELKLAAAVELFFGVKMEFSAAAQYEYNVADTVDLKLKQEGLTVEAANTALKNYFVAAQSTTATVDDQKVALTAAIKALNLNLGI